MGLSNILIIHYLLSKWIPISAAVVIDTYKQDNGQNDQTGTDAHIIHPGLGRLGVPGALFVFAKGPQIHGIADHIDPIHG